MTFPDVIHPDHLDEQLALHAGLVAGKRTAYELEKRYLARDGRELWAFTRTTAVPAEPGTAIVVIQDITERKQMELALLRNSERLTQIVDTQRDVAAAGSDLDEVVAEGVESGPIWDRLSDLGCTVAQGYFLSRPLPDQLTPWLAQRRAAPGY